MKKALFLLTIFMISIFTSACINNLAVQELNNSAKKYMENEDYENAIARLKSSLDLNNMVFETHYNLAIAYTEAQDYENAVEEFEQTIKLKPDFNNAYYSLAVAQENFATDILNGTYKKKDKEFSVDEIEDLEDSDDFDTKLDDKLSKAEKDKILNFYNSAIVSYETFLDKEPQTKDKDSITTKISLLKEKVENPDKLFENR